MINNSKLIVTSVFLALFGADALAYDPLQALRQRQQAEQQRRAEEQQRRAEERQKTESAAMARYEFIGRDQDIVRDTVTGLQWTRCSLGQAWQVSEQTCVGRAGHFNYDQAMAFPELVNEDGGYASYTDWRLPTIDELRTLVFCSSGQPAMFKDADHDRCSGNHLQPTIVVGAFPNAPTGWVWSSSPADGHRRSGGAWGVHFTNGDVYSAHQSNPSGVRLVRVGQIGTSAPRHDSRVESLPVSALDFSGWWAFDPNGCFDTDNQYRVALGRWNQENEGIKFGVGQEKVGLYDSKCILSNRVENRNSVTYLALCYDEEGEKHEGSGKIILENEFTVRVLMPISPDKGWLLVRCGEKEENPGAH